MLRLCTGMIFATILLAIGFYAGRLTNPNGGEIISMARAEQPAMDFSAMIDATAKHMNTLPMKGKK